VPVVHVRPAFERAVTERIAWLEDNAPEEWLNKFLSALEDLRRDIEQFPGASPSAKQDERVVVRQKRFPRDLPYFVYYAHAREDPVREVFLTHLFHERQRRPRLDLSRWPW
jgi:hypothetical protein